MDIFRSTPAETERRDSERERIIESISDAIVVVDREGTVRFANAAAAGLFGRSRSELPGVSFGFPVVAGETTELDLAGGRVAEMRVVDVEWDGQPARLASLRDVTDRREAEDAARRLLRERTAREEGEKERARLQELLARAPAAVFTTRGKDHLCVFANPRASELLGGRELAGRPLGEALDELRGQGFFEAFERAFAHGDGDSRRELELRLRATGGEERRYLDVTWEPLRHDGSIDGVMCFAHDVTEQVATRRALERTMSRLRDEERRKDQFMAVLGHELRNPLAGIDGGLRLLEGGADEDRGRWAVSMMRSQVRQLTSLLDDLLDVSSIARGKLELRRQVVFLPQLVEAASASVGPRLVEAGQQLEVVLPDDPLAVDADARRLVQILCNLLVNASKYSDRATRIRLTARRENGNVAIEVSDQGQGIAANMVERIFEPFVQAVVAEDRPAPGGLGIGLTLVRQLAELHGGSASAYSAGPGHGSTFTVRLPLALAVAAEPRQERRPAASLAGCRILVVDDNRDAGTALTELLDLVGCRAQQAASGEEALRAAAEEDFDAILLDLDLPDLSGYEVAARLRGLPHTRDVRIIAVSGFGDEPSRERSRQARIDRHLIKPVDLEELMRVLSEERVVDG